MTIDRLLNDFDKPSYDAGGAERALFLLLKKYHDTLEDYFTDPDWNPYGFHKMFRQIDVIPDRGIDMVIWHLLSASKLIWPILSADDSPAPEKEIKKRTPRKKK